MQNWLRTSVIAIFSSLVILGTSPPAAAQGVGVGFKVGPTFADFTSDALDIRHRTGWHGGIFIGGNRDGFVGWQTEINWLRRAGDTMAGEGFHIDYVQVPVLLRVNIGTNSKNGFAVYGIGGPAFEFKVADEINGVTIDDAFEGTDVGVVVGAGVEITRLILEARYEWGFLRINKVFADVEEIKTRSFTLLVGVRFN